MDFWLYYFIDPVLRGPMLGSMLMCCAASLVGVIIFLRKQSLLGEALSHAAYPGVVFGVLFFSLFPLDHDDDTLLSIFIIGGAFFSAMIGLWVIHFLILVGNIRKDSALCFVLSSFFGIGLTLASQAQFTHTSLYRKAQIYLYGQAATMNDAHILIYGCLTLLVAAVLILFYKEFQMITFDRQYAKSIGIPINSLELLLYVLLVLAVVIGIRSVGVVLMSAMLLAPCIAARQYTNKLSHMLLFSAVIGAISGFLGNYFSVEATNVLLETYPGSRLSLPTGPTIVLVASAICLFSLLFAPKRGILWRMGRAIRFRLTCLQENLLKSLWRYGPEQPADIPKLQRQLGVYPILIFYSLFQLKRKAWIEHVAYDSKSYRLTESGKKRAEMIVRLHRLWEVYLSDYLDMENQKIHRSAEEMEHIITPEIEKELTILLKDPKYDPHHQPIPSAQVNDEQ